jgi:hypothetical protein
MAGAARPPAPGARRWQRWYRLRRISIPERSTDLEAECGPIRCRGQGGLIHLRGGGPPSQTRSQARYVVRRNAPAKVRRRPQGRAHCGRKPSPKSAHRRLDAIQVPHRAIGETDFAPNRLSLRPTGGRNAASGTTSSAGFPAGHSGSRDILLFIFLVS